MAPGSPVLSCPARGARRWPGVESFRLVVMRAFVGERAILHLDAAGRVRSTDTKKGCDKPGNVGDPVRGELDPGRRLSDSRPSGAAAAWSERRIVSKDHRAPYISRPDNRQQRLQGFAQTLDVERRGRSDHESYRVWLHLLHDRSRQCGNKAVDTVFDPDSRRRACIAGSESGAVSNLARVAHGGYRGGCGLRAGSRGMGTVWARVGDQTRAC